MNEQSILQQASWDELNNMLQPPAMLDLFKIVQAYSTSKFEASKQWTCRGRL